MKRKLSSLRKERKIIRLGYLWRWGSMGLLLLTIPATALFEQAISERIICLTFGTTLAFIGIYHIVGTILEFKHLLVACQIALTRSHPSLICCDVDLNPRRDWTPSEKRTFIGLGIIQTVVGLAGIILFFLG